MCVCVWYERRCAMNLNTLFIHNEISTEQFSFNKLNDKKMRINCEARWCRGNRNIGCGRNGKNEFNTSASERLDEIFVQVDRKTKDGQIKNWYLCCECELCRWRANTHIPTRATYYTTHTHRHPLWILLAYLLFACTFYIFRDEWRRKSVQWQQQPCQTDTQVKHTNKIWTEKSQVKYLTCTTLR